MTLIVTWLWQGLAIAWITAAAVRTMPRLNAATRHAVWWLALAAVLAIPIADGLAAIATSAPPAPGLTPLDLDTAAGALMLPAIPVGVVACAVAIWAMSAAFGVLRIGMSCRALGRLRRASSPFDRSREARLPLWVAARDRVDNIDNVHRGHRAAELRTSDSITGACALGLGRPVILVSRSVAEALSDESLDEIVMHEQAHLDRYDDWSQLLLSAITSIAGLHPAVRFLARRLDVDREAACDDRVVLCTGAARRYASSLLTVAAASNADARGVGLAAGVLTATTTASALRVRVGRLLDPRRDRGAQLASATSFVSLTALGLAVVISTQFAPAVIFVETAAGHTTGPAAAVATAIEERGTPEPAPPEITDASPGELERSLRVEPSNAERPAPSDAAARPLIATAPDGPPAAPLERPTIAADTVAPVPSVPLPAFQPVAFPSAPTPAPGPWEAVSDSATSAANDVARAAAETGARARSAGVSIGRFLTRAGKAGTSIF